jgi:2-polyprenyl-3-methyl-5-hydroxy-6-metoxy-1,4-benzoquinol methylase
MDRTPEPQYMDKPEEIDAYVRADFAEVNAKFVEQLLNHCPEPAPLRVIDLGCGPGDITAAIARARPTWSILGIDAASGMIDLARKHELTDACQFLCTDFRVYAKYASTATRFDVVCSNSLLHHIPDPADFWRGVNQLIRPGGLVFIRDLFRPDSPARARELVDLHVGKESALLKEEFHRSLLAAFTPDEITAQLKAADLKSLHVKIITDRHVDIVGRVR